METTSQQVCAGDQHRETLAHYDGLYFDWQRELGEFGGWANKTKFAPHISPTDTVLDFGCGGGFLLKNIECAKKIGVEVNDVARACAEEMNGILAVKFVDELEDEIADVIISEHALEHCLSPRDEIVSLLKKLKPGGQIVLVVPSESNRLKWAPGDINNHLFTWNRMTLGNLFTSAGYEVITVQALYQRWPPMFRQVSRFGRRIFALSCRIYGSLRRSTSEVKIVARRPLA
jgi:SAM-dependent methyltransferase